MKKRCFRCGEWLPLDMFYLHPGMVGGRVNKCKLCAQSDNRRYRDLNRSALIERQKEKISRGANSKTCSACGETKPIDRFYQSVHMKDGYSGICKFCAGDATAANRVANAERYREYDTAKSTTRKELDRKLKWQRENIEKIAAHHAVHYALKTGQMTRGLCGVCDGSKNIHAHHEDYSKHLDVVWLCHPHHMELHQKKRRETEDLTLCA